MDKAWTGPSWNKFVLFMAHTYSLGIIEAMDHLWFHQFVLFPYPLSPTESKIFPESVSFTSGSSLPFSSASSLLEGESASSQSQITSQSSMEYSNNEGDNNEVDYKKERSTRQNVLKQRRKLRKSMSLGELELKEVKGFMDLGFKFKKEHLSPRMVRVVPGLQRLGLHATTHTNSCSEMIDISESPAKDDEFIEEEKNCVARPYLSEAWLIKRPNSPLLNLKVPRASVAADMKRHLRFWARLVASEIQKESDILFSHENLC